MNATKKIVVRCLSRRTPSARETLFCALVPFVPLSVAGNAATSRNVPPHGTGLPPGYVEDASRLNPTPVNEVWNIPGDPAEAEEQLRRLLARAKSEGLKVSIAGAGHSMGGHTLYPDGIVLNMLPFHRMSLDQRTNLLTVGAGARWSDVLSYLDTHRRSVAVMQSNNTFTVGGSISVNAHGWQHDRPPIASTVESFRLMKADGSVVRCGRDENVELFRLALGGYGLFGVILDVELRVVPNEVYKLERYVVPADHYLAAYDANTTKKPDAEMVYGRLDIDPDHLFEEAILNVFRRVTSSQGDIPPLSEPGKAALRRTIFRGSVGTKAGKKVRWQLEKKLGENLEKQVYSRNQLLDEGVEVYEGRSTGRTDILQEYFVPSVQFMQFLSKSSDILKKHRADLLNVTVRDVREDHDTFLRYADQDLLALVMFYTQARTPEGEAQMEALTRDLIDAALSAGGRYYLPYRLHARVDQFDAAYPQARRFFKLKRKYDPDGLFQNEFYVKYAQQ